MELTFITEGRFIKKDDGIYTETGEFSNVLWGRYLTLFDKLRIFARVKRVYSYSKKDYNRSNGDNVTFVDLPNYRGPIGYIRAKNTVKLIINQNVHRNSAYICRVPGRLGLLLSKELKRQGIPYAVEVVGDPWDVFAPGAVKHVLSPLFRVSEFLSLRKVVRHASAALYVTESQLQCRYPVKKGVFSTNASNVQINDDSIALAPKTLSKKAEYKLVSVGSLAQMYKAPDILIKAISILNEQGINCGLTWVGDGCYKWEMMNYANELGVIKQVNFAGNVSKDLVFEILNESDLYIHPSRTEGLPRAVIEAMSQGLPCIGTKVGGIPELLSERALIKKDDPHALAEKIKEFILSPNVAKEEAKRNLIESHKYKESILDRKRKEFYQEIIKLSK